VKYHQAFASAPVGSIGFFFNYNPEPVELNLPPETKFVMGAAEMPAAGVTIVEVAPH